MPRVTLRNKLDPDNGSLSFSTGNRPTLAQFVQLNTSSIQHDGLVFCMPLWEPSGSTTVRDLVLGLVGAVYQNSPLFESDAMFGWHSVGGGNESGGGTNRVWRIPYNTLIDMGRRVPAAVADGAKVNWCISFWFRTTITEAPPIDPTILSFANTLHPWSGMGASMDTGNDIAINTGNTFLPDSGFDCARAGLYDLGWHHIMMTQIPTVAAQADEYACTDIYHVDGTYEGENNTCTNIGITTNDFFLLGDNHGTPEGTEDPPGACGLADVRLYCGGGNLINATTRLALAASLFNTATRWQLYLGMGLT